MEKILLTGGAGFIGSHIARKLIERGCEVIIFDAFVQYISPFESKYQKYLDLRFKGIKDKITFIRGDTRHKSHIANVIKEHRPDRVIHMAALPIADLSFIHYEETINTIVLGTTNLLTCIKDAGFVKRFVYTSSSMVYGDFEYEPADETHPTRPKDVYGGTKLAGEVLTESFGRRYGVKYTIIRPSAVYGPGDVNRRVTQIFLENALGDKGLVVRGGGENKLDFSFVEDVADGFVRATMSEKGENEIFNITRGESRSLTEYANELKKYFPSLKVSLEPMPSHRPKRGTLDITKAKTLLGYNPRYNLEDGIKRYVEWFQQIYQDLK